MFVLKQRDTGDATWRGEGGNSEQAEFGAQFDNNSLNNSVRVDAAFGRGAITGANLNATYIRLKRPDGSDIYAYVATGATAFTLSTTKP